MKEINFEELMATCCQFMIDMGLDMDKLESVSESDLEEAEISVLD